MHQMDVLPFTPGSTWSQNGSPAVTDGQEHEGRMFWIEDLNYTQGGVPYAPRAYSGKAGTNMYKLIRVVRNVSGITLQPGRLVTYQLTNYGRRVDGYATTTGQEAFPIDEFIPYNVPNNDLFYITLGGLAGIYSASDSTGAQSLSTAATTLVFVGAQTAVTSQSTTSGRIVASDFTGATSILANYIINRIGYALSARTTNQTNTLTLCFVHNDW